MPEEIRLQNMPEEDENLVMRGGVTITASVTSIKGSSASSPAILLNEKAHRLDVQKISEFVPSNTYDTYDGQNAADQPDWYAIQFPDEVTFNWIEMTMGFAYPDGGWWTALDIEVRRTADDSWERLTSVRITPAYDFSDGRGKRRPFETHILVFEAVTACAVRLIGMPGGSAQFTSLARIAIRHSETAPSRPIQVPEPPYPYLLRLISPQMIWDLSENFTKLTKIVLNFPAERFYLDTVRYEKLLSRIHPNYQGKPELWFLVADSVGWNNWYQLSVDGTVEAEQTDLTQSHVDLKFHKTLGRILAPITVEGQPLGYLDSTYVIVKDYLDLDWHRHFASDHNIAWDVYQAAIDRTPHMTMEQLEGAAGIVGMMTNTIANLAHVNLRMQRVLSAESASDTTRRLQEHAMQQAIAYMRQELETPISVAEVARRVGFSLPYFCTLFAQFMGMNPGDYLIHLRLERAKEYLTHTNMPIKDVCLALGYDPSYFARLFKKHEGMTAGEYAAKMRSRS